MPTQADYPSWSSRLPEDSKRFMDQDVSEERFKAFSDATSLLPHVVLDSVIMETLYRLDKANCGGEALSQFLYRNQDVERYICNRTVIVYENNNQWAKHLNQPETSRDYLRTFIMHWFAGVMKAVDPTCYTHVEAFLAGR